MPFLLVEIQGISVTKNTCVDPAAGAKKGCCRKKIWCMRIIQLYDAPIVHHIDRYGRKEAHE